ncbi:MAG: helix-turn-helix domain-containing protein [Gaiellales bacterium]
MSIVEAPQLLRLEEVAERLGMSRRGVYALIERGELRPLHLDRRPKFLEADVAALIERARAKAGDEQEEQVR